VSDYPLLWVTDSQQVAPFGETLRIAGLASDFGSSGLPASL
jgi:hypothetical protein